MVGKQEKAIYHQFLLLPQCIQRPSTEGSWKSRILWYWVKGLGFCLSVTTEYIHLAFSLAKNKLPLQDEETV